MRLERRLNSTYQRVFRNRHAIAKRVCLSDSAYRLWDLFVALYDWDKNHIETFGQVNATDRELAELLSWSPSKVCRYRNELIGKKVITLVGTSRYQIYPFPELSYVVSNPQEFPSKLQDEIATSEQKVAEVKQKQPQSDKNPLVSFKDNSSLLRPWEEYLCIWEEMGNPPDFTPDDMAFIDKSLYEEKAVKPTD